MKPFLAMIIPAHSGAHPDHELPTPPSVPGQPPGRPDHTLPGQLPKPEHPIYYPLPPGAPVDPEYGIPEDGPHPDQGLPGSQPHPDQGLPKPPPTGAQPPRPDQGLPGSQPHPDQGLPGPQPHPEHPIVLPPDQGGWGPIYIWGGGPGARPPIALPPEGQNPPGNIEWKPVWTPGNGWQVIGIVEPEKPHPTPSKR
jgi:hypothetical protein